MPRIRVLIVDDAVVVRKILADTLGSDPDLEISTAANGRIALQKLEQVRPDVVTMDLEMPEMDGLTTLRALRKTHPRLPVIMFSTLTERGAAATLDALAAGANDYVTKPANVGSVSVALARVREELIPKIKALTGHPASTAASAPRTQPLAAKATPRPLIATHRGSIELVAIGVSTGGPNALSELMPQLPGSLPVPVVLVQHMPPIFTKLLADRLNSRCALEVVEGAPGMLVKPGRAVLAAGGSHMVLARNGPTVTIATNMDPPENSCRPAVDVLFRSAVSAYGGRVLGVVLTGMGSDGTRGCELIREAGGQVFAQDEATSVVWGMPGYVVRAGLANRILPLNQVAGEIVRTVTESRRLAPTALAG